MYNFREVSPKLYRSSAPTTEEIVWLNKKPGITRIISLDESSGRKIALACKLLGIEHIMLPIDLGKKSTLIRFLSKFDKLLEDPQKTLIHCLHGKDRTGMAIAIYRCKNEGWSSEEAIDEAKTFGFGSGLDDSVVSLYISVIESADKQDDVNSASDIVDASRQSYDDYVGSPSGNLSWCAYNDPNLSGFPDTNKGPTGDGERNPLGGFGPSIVGGGTVI